MTQYAPQCKRRGHDEKHTDPIECDRYETESRAAALDDVMEEIEESREVLVSIRADRAAVEQTLGKQIREALTYGASVDDLASALGMWNDEVRRLRDAAT